MREAFLLLDGQTYVFMGDSLTADGQGYSMLVPEMVKLRCPERKIKFINAGVGGDRSVDMLARFDSDVLRHRPQWVSITSGANDVGRFFTDPPRSIDLDTYSDAIKQMVEKTISASIFPILISPPAIESHWPNGDGDKSNKKLGKYVDWMKKYALENHLFYVPMYETFLDVSKKARRKDPGFRLTEEGVHMNFRGKMLMAMTLLRSLGFGWKTV